MSPVNLFKLLSVGVFWGTPNLLLVSEVGKTFCELLPLSFQLNLHSLQLGQSSGQTWLQP